MNEANLRDSDEHWRRIVGGIANVVRAVNDEDAPATVENAVEEWIGGRGGSMLRQFGMACLVASSSSAECDDADDGDDDAEPEIIWVTPDMARCMSRGWFASQIATMSEEDFRQMREVVARGLEPKQ
jgi:hypothetical protein